ncbi:MAG TPA: TfoX/Sxy family protein [Terriglobia bacterium]|nr:TfoX/Sxy family protein [Terriglobia bacterium]
MTHADSFKDFIVDQLRDVKGLRVRRMFSGYGFYSDEVFFGIISKSRLYFKTDARSRQAYLDRDTKPFRPNPSQELQRYYEVPVEILEDGEELVRWAQEAIRVAASKNKGRQKVGKPQ